METESRISRGQFIKLEVNRAIDNIQKLVIARKKIDIAFRGLTAADQFEKEKKLRDAETLRIVSLNLLIEGIIEMPPKIDYRLPLEQPTF